MSKLTTKDGQQERFTMVPNRVLRSTVLTVYDKLIFSLIASCGAHDSSDAWPSYDVLGEWSGLSRERVWKSLQTLERNGLLRRFKKGRKIVYLTWWNSSSGEPMGSQSVRYTNYNSSSGELQSVRLANPIKTHDKELS